MVEQVSNLKEWRFIFKKNLRKLLPQDFLNLYFSLYPFLGNLIYNRPSRKIKIIGITGTDGKSSTVIFTTKILQQAGYKVGYFSSIGYGDGNKEYANSFKMTMPGRFFIQKFLRTLVSNKCDFCVIEVTSEGIKQKRHLFINFDIVLITNLKPEHIESHGNFENYKSAKATIFKNLKNSFYKGLPKTIIVNNDDKEAKSFLKYGAEEKMTFGINEYSDVKGEIIEVGLFFNKFNLTLNGQSTSIQISAGGPFIIENILAALAIAKALKIDFKTCINAVTKLTNPPGRFEIISDDPIIIVDYAHTVTAIKKLLSFIRDNWNGKIIHVFGAAGGGRDKWKRPHLAELSEFFTDFSILTEENSFDEPVINILNDINKGFKNKERVISLPDRREAIQVAIDKAANHKNTLLLFTGKGCETVMAGPFGRKIPYNEKETIVWLLDK